MARYEIQGAAELEKRLKDLPAKIQRKLGSQALRAGAKIISAREKSEAPRGKTKRLAKAITVRAVKRSRKRNGLAFVVKSSYAETWYGRLVEWGRRIGRRNRLTERLRTEGRKNHADTRSEVPANPFGLRAFQATQAQALAAIAAKLRDGLSSLGK